MTDQQRFDTIRALGFPYMETPHLDRIAREGTVFTNCFCSAASCAPARASLFTGCYPHTTGIYRNGDLWRHSWVEALAEAGYHCVNIGKMHTYPYETPLGFHERFVVENKDRYLEGRWFFDRWDLALQARGLVKPQRELYRKHPEHASRLGAFEWELPEDMHSDFYVGGLARWWLQTKPRTEPLFLQIGFPGPHPPYDPIRRYAEPYLARDLPLPQVTAEELESQPAALKELRLHNTRFDHDSVLWSLDPRPEQLRRLRAYYLANVTMIDEQVGRILESLEARGYLENAVVVFTSDHGDCLGDHGHIQKWSMFDAVTRIPLLVWAPGRFASGRSLDLLCQQFDIAPVLLDLAGCKAPDSWETESLLPALQGQSATGAEYRPGQRRELPRELPAAGRQFVFAEQARDADNQTEAGAQMMTMVRSRDWKLVHYLGGSEEGELYDLVADSGERRNLWADSAAVAQKRELLDALRDWRISSSLRTRAWTQSWR